MIDMLRQLRTLFRQIMQDGSDGGVADTPKMHLAMASLLCEVANADYKNDPKEEVAKVHILTRLLDVDEASAKVLMTEAHKKSKTAVSLFEFTNQLRTLRSDERFQLIEAMWQVAYTDGIIDPMEEAVIRQVADLIYVEHSEFIRAKLSVQERLT